MTFLSGFKCRPNRHVRQRVMFFSRRYMRYFSWTWFRIESLVPYGYLFICNFTEILRICQCVYSNCKLYLQYHFSMIQVCMCVWVCACAFLWKPCSQDIGNKWSICYHKLKQYNKINEVLVNLKYLVFN